MKAHTFLKSINAVFMINMNWANNKEQANDSTLSPGPLRILECTVYVIIVAIKHSIEITTPIMDRHAFAMDWVLRHTSTASTASTHATITSSLFTTESSSIRRQLSMRYSFNVIVSVNSSTFYIFVDESNESLKK